MHSGVTVNSYGVLGRLKLLVYMVSMIYLPIYILMGLLVYLSVKFVSVNK